MNEYQSLEGLKLGFALCGSFCTFDKALLSMRALKEQGAQLTPILSYHAASLDTRFGKAEDWQNKLREECGREIIMTIDAAEPIGPKKMFDALIVAPCTGNTLGKLAHAITDTPVLMACKSHLRNARPVILAVSTNDALGGCAKNIGILLNSRNIYFVPMSQDDAQRKPRSIVADFDWIGQTVLSALQGIQIQPIYL